MKYLCRILCLFLTVVLMAACSEDDKPKTTKERTVLVYMSAENSLSDFVQADLKEMIKGARSLSDNESLVVFLDSPNNNSKLYRIDRNGQTEIKDYGEDLVSTDISVLKRVLGDTEAMLPAKEYAMVMWSHASGWQPENLATRSFGQDTNPGTLASQMDIPKMAEALQGFTKMKYIMFDACFMQCIEVAYDLRNVTDYILAAPCEIPGTGAYYDKLVPAMFSTTPAEALVDNYYRPYIAENEADQKKNYGAVMAALDCSQVEHFTTVTREVLPNYDASMTLDIPSLQMYLAYDAKSGWGNPVKISPYYDIKGEMRQLLSDANYQKWEDALNRLIVAKGATDTFLSVYHSPNVTVDKEKFSGLAGYIPNLYPDCEQWDALFRETNWYTAAGWKEKGW